MNIRASPAQICSPPIRARRSSRPVPAPSPPSSVDTRPDRPPQAATGPDISSTTLFRAAVPCEGYQHGRIQSATFLIERANPYGAAQLTRAPRRRYDPHPGHALALHTYLFSRFPFPTRKNPYVQTAATPSRIARPPGPRTGRWRLYRISSNPPTGGMSLEYAKTPRSCQHGHGDPLCSTVMARCTGYDDVLSVRNRHYHNTTCQQRQASRPHTSTRYALVVGMWSWRSRAAPWQ